MSITAVVKNDTIKLPLGMHVPDGTQARIIFEPATEQNLLGRYAALVGFTDALPEDMAENRDWYLHGKRTEA